ncbi:hypothetical protein K438DRAFT_1762454 [Mycena galopus ATCC 62051]|nr:hypothetical protein K438DRAFT_1762454 [Mycena galopus ATCC 62051]
MFGSATQSVGPAPRLAGCRRTCTAHNSACDSAQDFEAATRYGVPDAVRGLPPSGVHSSHDPHATQRFIPTPPYFPPRLQRPSAAPSHLHRLTSAPSVCSAGHDPPSYCLTPAATRTSEHLPPRVLLCWTTPTPASSPSRTQHNIWVQATLREQRDPASALPLEHVRTTILGVRRQHIDCGGDTMALYTAPAIQDRNAIKIAADDLRGCPPLTVSAGGGKGMEATAAMLGESRFSRFYLSARTFSYSAVPFFVYSLMYHWVTSHKE